MSKKNPTGFNPIAGIVDLGARMAQENVSAEDQESSVEVVDGDPVNEFGEVIGEVTEEVPVEEPIGSESAEDTQAEVEETEPAESEAPAEESTTDSTSEAAEETTVEALAEPTTILLEDPESIAYSYEAEDFEQLQRALLERAAHGFLKQCQDPRTKIYDLRGLIDTMSHIANNGSNKWNLQKLLEV